MKEHVLHIGDVRVFDNPVIMICFGLGSCVGLFMQDRAIGLSGGAHILLPSNMPDQMGSGGWFNVQEAFKKILDGFKEKGSQLLGLRAKIAGGSNVLKVSTEIGQKNIQSLTELLIKSGVYIAATEVGGAFSRTVRFHSSTGEMYVRTLEDNSLKVF